MLGQKIATPAELFSPAYAASVIISGAVGSMGAALLVQLVYDTKLQRPVRLSHYFGKTLKSALPIIVLCLAVTILSMLTLLMLVVPGLWVMAVFSVTIPAIIIESVGFRGLGRSAELTKEYRWPIAGLAILELVLVAASGWGAKFLAVLLESTAGTIPSLFLYVVITTIRAGLLSLPAALIYARLREIKEGVTVDQIAAVFD